VNRSNKDLGSHRRRNAATGCRFEQIASRVDLRHHVQWLLVASLRHRVDLAFKGRRET
jgi:hypothetical protein